MLKTIKTVFYTLTVVFIFTFSYVVWHTYTESVAESKEIETQEVVDALEEIISITKPHIGSITTVYHTVGTYIESRTVK